MPGIKKLVFAFATTEIDRLRAAEEHVFRVLPLKLHPADGINHLFRRILRLKALMDCVDIRLMGHSIHGARLRPT